MGARKAVDGLAGSLMGVLCLLWSLQQVALKAAAPQVAPMLQIGLRSGVAALLVAGLMRTRGERMSLQGGAWRPGLLVGALFALEYLLVGQGLRLTSASHMVVFLYTAPIFAALGLQARLPAERLQPLQWAGIGLAFTGIALAFIGRGASAATGGGTGAPVGDAAMGDKWVGDALGLLAGAAWGATTVVVRSSRLAALPATQTLLYQLVIAFVLLTAAASVLGQGGFDPTPMVWLNLAFQALVVSFASFLAWFWLLRHYLASQLGVFSFMTPLFGVAWGVALLGEPLERSFVVGGALVLAGIVLVSGQGVFKRAAAA